MGTFLKMNNKIYKNFYDLLESKTKEERLIMIEDGLFHMLKSKKIEMAVNFLKDEHVINERYQVQNIEAFIDDFYIGYIEIKKYNKELIKPIINNMVKFFIKKLSEGDGKLTPEIIHSLLVYKKDTEFYDQILILLGDVKWVEENIVPQNQEKIITTFQTRLANAYRRKGNLTKSKKILQNCLQRLENDNIPDELQFEEFSRVEYEIGYIYFLEGNAKTAIKRFESSIEYAQKSNNLIGEWITQCVKMRCAFLHNIVTGEEFKKTLNKAEIFFSKNIETTPVASRWLMNIKTHFFEIIFFENQHIGNNKIDDALGQVDFLKNDQWLKMFSRQNNIKVFEARVHIMKKDWSNAIKCFKSYLPQTKQELFKKSETEAGNMAYEGIAQYYLDYGKSLYKINQLENAKNIWDIGLACPENFGNTIWHTKIRNLILTIAK